MSCGDGCVDGALATLIAVGSGVVCAMMVWWIFRRQLRLNPDPRRRHWWAWWTQMLLALGGMMSGAFLGGWTYAVAMGIGPDEPFRLRGNIFVFIGAMSLGGLLFAVAGIVLSLFIVRRKLTVEETLDLGEYLPQRPGYRELAIALREPSRRLLNWLGLGEEPTP
jgi:MFS family permease